MQDKKVRTFGDLTEDEFAVLSKLFMVVANCMERDLNVRIEKFYVKDSAGTLTVGIERTEPEEGDPDA